MGHVESHAARGEGFDRRTFYCTLSHSHGLFISGSIARACLNVAGSGCGVWIDRGGPSIDVSLAGVQAHRKM